MGKKQLNRNYLGTMPQLTRLHGIVKRIQEGDYPSQRVLAEEWSKTTRTIQADLDFIRDFWKLPLFYDERRYGYYFSEAVGKFPMVPISEGELVSVFVAQKALSQYHGTPFEKPLRSAFQKLVGSLQGEISVAWADLDSAISFRGIETNVGDMEVLRTLGEAVRGRREVEFEYFKLEEEGGGAASSKAEIRRPKPELGDGSEGEGGEGAPGLWGTGEMRRVRPYHLVCIWNQWYLVAYDLMREDIRKFVPARMRDVRLRDARFERPKEFSVDKYLKGSFGVYSGGELMELKVWFSRARAQVVRERKWHASQRIRELGNGEIEYSVRLSSLKEIVPWILGWGEHARAIAPKALVEAMKGVVGRVGKLYDGTGPSLPV